MAQIKTFSWTNPNPAVARNLDVGFTVAQITTIDVTNGGSWMWVTGMPAASSLDVDAGTISLANGFTLLAQNAIFGAEITGFTNANPGVITASNIAQVGIVAGDTIKVTDVADDGSATTLNGTYVVASVTATAITTATDTTAFSVYVSGGYAVRTLDAQGKPVPIENKAIRGITIGTTPVGAASADMVAIVSGQNSVV